MPLATSHVEYYVPSAVGPLLQSYPTLPTALPASIAVSGSWSSGVLTSNGYLVLSCGVTLSQNGTLAVQRYIDQTGVVAQGAAVSQSLTAGTPAVLNVSDRLPFGSFKITITNSGGSSAVPSAFVLLMTGDLPLSFSTNSGSTGPVIDQNGAEQFVLFIPGNFSV